jgi:hypothetical protein
MPAAYANTFARVTISGTCAGGAEEWSTGFQLGTEGEDVGSVQNGSAETVAGRWTTFFTQFNNSFSNKYKTTVVKVAVINPNGTTNQDEISYYSYPTPLQGGGSTQALPPQITLAATMTSQYQRGLASKGRMYLPGLNAGINGDNGRIDGSFIGLLATAFKGFLDGVNTDQIGGAQVIIASKGHLVKPWTPGTPKDYVDGRSAYVTGCRIGDVYDTQRRRRDGLVETYTSRVLA